MGRKKTADPVLVRLMDEREVAKAAAEKWWSRLRRAVTAVEDYRGRVKRLTKRIAAREAELATPTEKEPG